MLRTSLYYFVGDSEVLADGTSDQSFFGHVTILYGYDDTPHSTIIDCHLNDTVPRRKFTF